MKFFIFILFFLTSCYNKNNESNYININNEWVTDKIEDGIKYRIVELGNENKPNSTNYISYNYSIYTTDGAKIVDTFETNYEITESYSSIVNHPFFSKMVPKISEKGSIIFILPNKKVKEFDSEFILSDLDIIFKFSINSVINKQEYELKNQENIDKFTSKQLEQINNNINWITDLELQGIRFKILQESFEPLKILKGQKIKAHYSGWLSNNKLFDSSIGKNPLEFTVGASEVIEGWDIILQDMKKGEKRIIVIPPHLAYKDIGVGILIPPYSYLIFEIEVLRD